MAGVRELERGHSRGMHGDGPKLGEARRPRDVVVMDVSLERVGDQDPQARGGGEVRIDLAVGVDEEGQTGIRIRHQITRVAKTAVKELLDEQIAATLLVRDRLALLADRLGFLLEDLFARAGLVMGRYHRRDAFVDALALRLRLLEGVLWPRLFLIHALGAGQASCPSAGNAGQTECPGQ